MAKKKCESRFMPEHGGSKVARALQTLAPQSMSGSPSVPADEVNITITSNGETIYPVPAPNDEGFNDFMYDFLKFKQDFKSRVENPMYVYSFALEIITKITPRTELLSVLDVGCADGVFETLLEKNCGIKAHGVEVSLAGRKAYFQNMGREASASIDNVSGTADVVTAIETLEHIPDHVETLNKMWARTGTVLIFTVPREDALGSPDHKHIFNFYDIYELCNNLNPKPRDFGIYQINKMSKFGNPLNVFGVVVWK